MTISAPCSCGQTRIPYGSVTAPDSTGAMHRAYRCDGQTIEVPAAAPVPEAWRLLNHECEHGETWWATGPDPDALVAELGCDCERGAA